MRPDTISRYAFALALLLASIGWGTTARAQSFTATSPDRPSHMSGTLTAISDAGDITASLQAAGPEASNPEVDVESLTITVDMGTKVTGAITLSNAGGDAAADLAYSVSSKEILYQQVEGISTSGVISQNNVTQTSFDNILADDFTVPSGEAWDITQVNARGFYTEDASAGDCVTVDVTFWTDDDDAPGTKVETRSAAPTEDNGGELLIEFEAASLSSGDYWISVACNGPNLDTDTRGRWNWFGNSAGSFGEPAQFRNDGGGFGIPDGWNSVVDLNAEGHNIEDRDLDFYLARSLGTSFVTASPDAGTITLGNSEEIVVTVDATDAEPGEYDYEVVISTNDPETPTLTVPVTVIVESTVAIEGGATPTAFALSQNYPNPFAGTTTIEYALPESAHVTITVYDAVGHRVATLVDEALTAGYHKAEWDTGGLASGVYLYRIQAGDYVKTKKMSLVR